MDQRDNRFYRQKDHGMATRNTPPPGFQQTQRETAQHLGYGADVDAMNRDHDPLHRALCGWLGVPCVALPDGQPGTELAGIEEDAVLAVQKLMRAHGAPVPT